LACLAACRAAEGKHLAYLAASKVDKHLACLAASEEDIDREGTFLAAEEDTDLGDTDLGNLVAF
jgi:hypothetical protein